MNKDQCVSCDWCPHTIWQIRDTSALLGRFSKHIKNLALQRVALNPLSFCRSHAFFFSSWTEVIGWVRMSCMKMKQPNAFSCQNRDTREKTANLHSDPRAVFHMQTSKITTGGGIRTPTTCQINGHKI